jgi:hypothetical protein
MIIDIDRRLEATLIPTVQLEIRMESIEINQFAVQNRPKFATSFIAYRGQTKTRASLVAIA